MAPLQPQQVVLRDLKDTLVTPPFPQARVVGRLQPEAPQDVDPVRRHEQQLEVARVPLQEPEPLPRPPVVPRVQGEPSQCHRTGVPPSPPHRQERHEKVPLQRRPLGDEVVGVE